MSKQQAEVTKEQLQAEVRRLNMVVARLEGNLGRQAGTIAELQTDNETLSQYVTAKRKEEEKEKEKEQEQGDE